MQNLSTYIKEAERVGPHYFLHPIEVSEQFKIHWTPEGCKYYKEHYQELLTHTKNKEHHGFIEQLIRRIEEAEEYYKSNVNPANSSQL